MIIAGTFPQKRPAPPPVASVEPEPAEPTERPDVPAPRDGAADPVEG